MPHGDLLYALTTTLLAQDVGGQPAASPANAPGISILQYIQSGGVISFILILLSILAVALMITNLIVLRREHLMPEETVEELEKLSRVRNLEGIVAFANHEQNDSFIARVILGGLSKSLRSQFGMLELKPALEDTAAIELEKIDRPTHGLALLAAIGPMLGLLGTVIGMIGAFGTISKLEGAARSSQLSDFMSLALVNTAEGLVLAIPCTIAYSLFRRRTDRLMREAAEVAERLAAYIQGPPTGARQPAAPRPIAMPRPMPAAYNAQPVQAPAVAPVPGAVPPAQPVQPRIAPQVTGDGAS